MIRKLLLPLAGVAGVVESGELLAGFDRDHGLGREGGPDALGEYTEEKFIALDRSGGIENKAFAIVIDPES